MTFETGKLEETIIELATSHLNELKYHVANPDPDEKLHRFNVTNAFGNTCTIAEIGLIEGSGLTSQGSIVLTQIRTDALAAIRAFDWLVGTLD